MIVVTGGAGLIGSNVIKKLNQVGVNDILVVDNLKNGKKVVNLSNLDITDYIDKLDFLEDIKSNLKIDLDRIYLTGLSMGGRGTFIVASQLPNIFAAIMPLSPHHTPYSYLPLVEKVSHLPTFLHHSTNDSTSKFSVAQNMFNKLKKINKNIVFDIGNSGHSGWNKIYRNPKNIEWLLSWKK